MTKLIQNFWQLVQTHRIEIPIIQRDYVQGQDSSKINPIREEFVKVIRTTLKDAKTLHLNFIYGKINGIQNAQQLAKNTEAVKNMLNAVQSYSQSLDLDINFSVNQQTNNSDGTHYTSFIPLDGQQRLTTLYLIHWYLLKRLKYRNELNNLKNFSYKIRPSSRDFCEALVDKSDFDIEQNEVLSKQITNRSWYFLYWAKDPTVRSMLNMLDSIHQAFANDSLEDLKIYWQRLTDEVNPVIRFEFLNLQDYDLTDELYIKMNARGKPLTEFENFKSWLMEYVEENGIKIDEKLNWKHNLDTKWADLFWNNKGEGNYTIDQAYMNFFRNMFQIFYVQDKEFDAENKEQRENAQALTDSKNLLSYSFYEKIGVLTEKGLNIIFEIIDLLADKEKGVTWISDQLQSIDFFNGKRTLFKAFVSGNMSYPDKVRFSAMIIYLLKNGGEKYSKTAFVSWMRIIRNLVENTTVDDTRPFKRAIHSLAELTKNCSNIYQDFEEIGYRGFSVSQYLEEERKVILIKRGVISEAEFLKYENHKYFKAEISFLLDLSLENRDKFIEYGEKCAFIFGDEFDNSNFLLERAFLATHNYLIPKGGNHTFLNIKEWKQSIFKTSHLLFFQGLLDKIEVEKDIVKELEKIKDSYINDDWRKLLIDYSAAMRYCKRNRIRIYKNADEVRLLEGIVLGENRGQNRELHSYCFYLKIKRNYIDNKSPLHYIRYHTISGYSTVPCAFLNAFTRTKTYNYAMDIYFVGGEYNIRFFNRNNNYVEGDVIERLYDLNYHSDNKGSYFYESIATMDEVEQALLDICDELPQFKIST